jgi:hypothetical protein
MILINTGANENKKNFPWDIRILPYTVDNAINPTLGKIMRVNSIDNDIFSGSFANPGAMIITNSFAKIITKIEKHNIPQKIRDNILDEKYRAPLNLLVATKSVKYGMKID